MSVSLLEEVERSAPKDGGPVRFGGSLTALITPFASGERQLDERAFARLVEWQIEEGTEGLVVAGTTGEAPTLTATKHDRLLRVAIEAAAGRVPVIAGAGTNCTRSSIELTQAARAAGADAALLVTPYYNKPMQEGLYRHFYAIAGSVDLPLILYRSSCTMCHAGRALTLSPTRSRCWRPSRTSSASRTRRATWPGRWPPPARPGPASSNSRATTRLPPASTSWADGGASPWSPTSRRGCAPTCSAPAGMATTRPRRPIQARLATLVSALERETNPGPIKLALSLLSAGVEYTLIVGTENSLVGALA